MQQLPYFPKMNFQQVLPLAPPLGKQLTLATKTYDDEAALDLLDKLIKFDPSERISAADALRHPYFTATTAGTPNGPSSASSPATSPPPGGARGTMPPPAFNFPVPQQHDIAHGGHQHQLPTIHQQMAQMAQQHPQQVHFGRVQPLPVPVQVSGPQWLFGTTAGNSQQQTGIPQGYGQGGGSLHSRERLSLDWVWRACIAGEVRSSRVVFWTCDG